MLTPDETLKRLVSRAAKSDPAQAAVEASVLLRDLQQAAITAKAVRVEAVNQLLDEGWTLDDVGELLGVNRARAHQIANGRSGPTGKHYEAK